MLSMTGLRFGVVGTGYWAREAHLPGLIATPEAKVVGIWGRTPAMVQEIAIRYGVTRFDSFDRLLDAVDAVTMAVPPDVQADLSLRAARAGKHMILEKPIARDTTAARAVAAAVERAGVASLVFFLSRFQPEIGAAIAAAAGHRWTRAEVRVHSSVMVTASPYAGSVWRQQPGAALWDIGPHALSVLIPLLGDVTAVEAWQKTESTSRLRTEHADGGTAEISLSLRSPPDQASKWYRVQSPTRDLILPNPIIDRAAVFGRAAQRLIAMAASGELGDLCDVRLGARVVEVLGCADDSARSGQRRPVPPPSG